VEVTPVWFFQNAIANDKRSTGTGGAGEFLRGRPLDLDEARDLRLLVLGPGSGAAAYLLRALNLSQPLNNLQPRGKLRGVLLEI
jgi:hypothetical protein